MAKWLLCSANVSEGRRPEVVEALVAAVAAAPEVYVLGVAANPADHRTVITLAVTPAGAVAGALALAGAAVRLIDVSRERGLHPRIGAVDVLPFSPLAGCTPAECAEVARTVGRALAERLGLPVYLFGGAALRPERADLAAIRAGEWEGLRERAATPEWAPDYGPTTLHPTAGATAVGVRPLRLVTVLVSGGRPLDDRAVARVPGVRAVRPVEEGLEVHVDDPAAATPAALAAAAGRVEAVRPVGPVPLEWVLAGASAGVPVQAGPEQVLDRLVLTAL